MTELEMMKTEAEAEDLGGYLSDEALDCSMSEFYGLAFTGIHQGQDDGPTPGTILNRITASCS